MNHDEMPETLSIGSVETPLGRVWIAASDFGVRVVTVPGATEAECIAVAGKRTVVAVGVAGDKPILDLAERELCDYFAGTLRDFTVPLDLHGTPFQQRVWSAVFAVPYGATTTYREIAEQIGSPNAFRAVGAANGANPAAIIVPCHRIIGSSGGLQGYGGGLHQKRALLDHEAGLCPFPSSPTSGDISR
ncbi:MAG TPA: methylated-DNA--[protein]-cysteine S-methyltransferase [Nitrolancea sp.]|nr:methylated-DNA--[protein]-cysteine S-methyltransferase [Nitrolancea sp.]